ncbi:pyridoxal phosphate-dependent aminotransferase [Pediococcus claussenii]|uniref:Aminotransferase n=1 Tax=Pediococcus claussenii (strain ATCC BAA-344 / DSM 14800 / JCM 18046 / KCTC 3811 / LMG 21948 / P06) TaxID=701521 RepID=G8PEE4_PEDCP|nr:pyridoxal phosphate-dependent aminotransferase [Pediococcus claussenii]AEV94405.1 beta-eliminating lyase family protein [Pediococcus claussenii ATCC BAA-344]ANZ69626.1 aspartate aminotransferase [Pediococcus claussenii]ANZ71443.1 aspartate aminotransferase [Pediococcus claussenii]KRN19891.1 hypothetical protein IV79_GL001180 [Pediococcus claussenii]
MQLSKRVLNVSPSATLAVSAESKRMQANGIDVVNLSAGEPDFATPQNIQKAAIKSIQNGTASYYTPVPGLPELRQAVSDRIQADTGRVLTTDHILITTGAKMALYELFQALVEPNDEVILIAPFWVSYEEQIKLAGGQSTVVHPSANDMKVTVEELDKVVTRKTKMIIINSPQNPSGLVYSKEEMHVLAKWALKRGILFVVDEIYGNLVYNGQKFTSVLTFEDDLVANTVVINGVSKSYAMTGWRIGYAIAQPELIKKMSALQGHMTSNPSAVAQYAAIEALSGEQKTVIEMKDAFQKRLNRTADLVEALPGFHLKHKPTGAFYLFPNVEEAMAAKGYDSSAEFAMELLQKAHVAVVAGEGFGMPGYIRLSYATSQEQLDKAMNRIQEFLAAK